MGFPSAMQPRENRIVQRSVNNICIRIMSWAIYRQLFTVLV
jgi:hypothetical protein